MEIRVSIERANEITRQLILSTESETISIHNAHGRILSQSLESLVDDPPFDNSAMDGWAVRSIDCTQTPTILRIVGVSKAGGQAPPPVNSGEAVRIMTGAPIPQGADAIVMIEESEFDDEIVTINGLARTNYIRRRGENLRLGFEALPAGAELTPARIALAATMGYGTVPVIQPLKVAIIATGDELVEPGEIVEENQIYESNTIALSGLLKKIGCEPVRYPSSGDNLDGFRRTLNEAAARCDVILTSGGVSMGEFDYVRKILESEGKILFWKMKIRPGGPPICGIWNGTPLFGLPGNPVSSQVVFLLLVAPWIARVCGYDSEMGPKLADEVRVRALEEIKGAAGKVALRRILITNSADELVASTPTHQGSGNQHSLVAGNGLTLLPPDISADVGDMISALWLR